MAKWVTSYLRENEQRWNREKLEREKEHRRWLEDWAKKTRLEKIREIKERDSENRYHKSIKLKLNTGKLCPSPHLKKPPTQYQ